MLVVKVIPYRTFKEKIKIVSENIDNGYVEVINDIVCIKSYNRKGQ